MQNLRVAQRYANALLTLANEQGKAHTVASDMQLMATTAHENRELRLVFKNPIIKSPDKIAILRRLFAVHFDSLTISFLDLVVSKRRDVYVMEIADAFLKLYKTQEGILEAKVTTAVALDDHLREHILSYLRQETGKTIELSEQIDPSIIGGYLLQIQDRQIDETISSKLDTLKLKLIDQSYIPQI
jgi:F-type H+-transporting ATPase subunit delta